MRTWMRLAAFAAGMAILFVAAMGVGQAVGPAGGLVPTTSDHGGSDHGGSAHAGDARHPGHGAPTPAGGLGVSQDGYTLVAESTTFTAGTPSPFRFTITDRDGRPVTGFTLNHDRRMHLVLARRDLSGYQHLHPTMAPDGTWSVPLALDAPGSYRAFADFVPTGRDTALTLGVDLAVPGDAQPQPLPEPSPTAQVEDYTVALDGQLHAGSVDTLRLRVLRDGRPVTDLQPYLGALGHLVVLRQGDLGYLHVHSVDGLTFQAGAPTAGTYRMYLDFKHENRVRTAEFTARVRGGVT